MAVKRENAPYYHAITTLAFISLTFNCANATSYSVSVSPSTVGIDESVTLSCRITNPTGLSVMWRRNIGGVFHDVGTATTKQGCIFNPAFDATNYRWDICGASTASPRDYNLQIIKAGPNDTSTWDCFDIGAGKPSDPVKVKVQGLSTDYAVGASKIQPAIGDLVVLYCRLKTPPGIFTVLWRRRQTPQGKTTTVAETTIKLPCRIVSGSGKYGWDICQAPSSAPTNLNFNLKILKAEEADSAYWDCYDIGKGSASELLHLQVKVPPITPTITGLDRPVGVGTTHTLTCDAHQPGISDPITYTWYKDNIVKATGSTLPFIPITRTDAGTYKCEAKNAVATKVSQKLDLEVYYPPDAITLSSTKSTRTLNEQETFTCTTSGGIPPNPTLTIYRDKGGKQELLNGAGPTIEVKDRTMVKDDNGAKFYCESSLSGYPSVSKRSNEITYTVYYPHTVTLLTNSSTTVVAGTTFTLTCNAIGGNPETVKQYTWSRNGKTLQSTSRVYYHYDVKYNDGGIYGCTATNDGGSASDSMTITVRYPPMWNPALPEVLTSTASLKQPAKFTLHVIANPAATGAAWFRYHGPTNFTNLDSDFTPAKVNETTYTLAINSVKEVYFGQYKVDVTSPTGPSTFIFILATPDKPYPPCCVNVTNETSVSVTLTFKAGFFGGSEQMFTIELRENSGSWRDARTNVRDPGTDRTATERIKDLKAETRYEFRVYGQNNLGRSEYSNIAGTKTDAAPPIIDDDISVTRKDTTITVSWPALGRRYTKIDIEYCVIRGEKRGDCATHEVKDTSVTKTIITVEEGKEYGFTLRIYDSGDIVFRSVVLASRTELPIVPIAAGAAGGSVLLLIIIIVTAVCVSKKRKENKEKGDIELHSKKRGSMDIGSINPGFQDDFKRRDEARKDSLASILDKGHFSYEDVSINNYCPKMTSNVDLSAIINKPTNSPPMAEYAQVDLAKKTRPNNLNEPPGIKVNNDINKGDIYAEVDHSKKAFRPHLTVDDVSMDGTDPDQAFEIKIRVKVPSPKPGHKAQPPKAPKPKTKAKPGAAYENTDIRTNINDLNINSSGDAVYATTGDDVYQEVGVGRQNNPPKVGVDGTIYADVNLMNRNPSIPAVIKQTEPSSEYAQVDFGRKAPPMNGKVEEI